MRILQQKNTNYSTSPQKMEMRAKEYTKTSTDITPQIPPLAHSLYTSFLTSHCSSCFLPLTTIPPSSSSSTTSLHFCNNNNNGICSSSSSSPSSEHNLLSLLTSNPSLYPYSDSSDLRLALRLLNLLPPTSPSLSLNRLFGLQTNYHLITRDRDSDRYSRVRDGAKAIAAARGFSSGREFELEEAVLCLVNTNAVEINLNGYRVGIGVYQFGFSWINHSCSPNSCFRFVSVVEVSDDDDDEGSLMRIFPYGDDVQMEDTSDCTTVKVNGVGNYGPRIVVRSIKEIESGEEVTITYTDLLQPTELRQSELLLEYKFFCNCRRCGANPQAYVDHALQEIFCFDLNNGYSKTLDKHSKDLVCEELRDVLDSTVEEYMEEGNPVSCCEKVERLLSEALLDELLEQSTEASRIQVKLSPLHSLSLNAYTTLISTYKIRAALSTEEMQLQTIDLSRTSTAYSLLLASATNHLFLSEPSLIASAATFWIDAGKSLLCLGGSWNSFVNAQLRDLSVITDVHCPNCSLMVKFKSATSFSQTQDKLFNDVSKEFHRCVSTITPKIWSFLTQGCKYLENVKDPIDFSWIEAMRTPGNSSSMQDDRFLFHRNVNGGHVQHVSGMGNSLKADIMQLGVHCLLYGGYLSGICYGRLCSRQLIENVNSILRPSLREHCCTL